jgi:hypothetical protein
MLRSREQLIRERAYGFWRQEGCRHGRDVDHWLRAEAELAALGEYNCIFGDGYLGPSTRPEHVLLNSLGGRWTTKSVICSYHNNIFGGNIDNEVANQVKIVRNLLQLESGTGKSPPAIRNVQAGRSTINIRNDGRPELTGKPFTVQKMTDGRFVVSVTANSEEHLNTLIPHIAAQIGCSEEDLRHSLIAADVRHIAAPPGIIDHDMSFGGCLALRSIVKSCLVLWTLATNNEHVRSGVYDEARRFVLEGNSPFYKSQINMDSRFIEPEGKWIEKFGPVFNLLHVQSNDDGRVIGHFTLYNIVSWRLVLADAGGIPNTRMAIASNPLDPAKWSDAVADEIPIDFEWLDSSDYDLARCKARVERVVQKYFQDARERIQENMR